MVQPFGKTPIYKTMQDRIQSELRQTHHEIKPMPPGMARLLKPTLRGTELGVLMGGYVGLRRCSRISSTTHLTIMGRLTLYKNGCWISYLILKCNDILWSVELHKPALFGRFQTTSSVSCTELYFWMHAPHCSNIVLWCLYDACSGEAFEVARRILIRNVQRALVLLPLLPSVPGQSWHVNSPVPFAIWALVGSQLKPALLSQRPEFFEQRELEDLHDTLWWSLIDL